MNATPQPQSKKRDLSAFCGSWNREEAAEFDKNIAICEKIDEELWKKDSAGMNPRVKSVEPLDGYKLRLQFTNGGVDE